MTYEVYQKQEGLLRTFMSPMGTISQPKPDPILFNGLQSIVELFGRIVFAAEQNLAGDSFAIFSVSTDMLDKKIFMAKGQQTHMSVFAYALNNYLQTVYGPVFNAKGITLSICEDTARDLAQVDRKGMRAYFNCGLNVIVTRGEQPRNLLNSFLSFMHPKTVSRVDQRIFFEGIRSIVFLLKSVAQATAQDPKYCFTTQILDSGIFKETNQPENVALIEKMNALFQLIYGNYFAAHSTRVQLQRVSDIENGNPYSGFSARVEKL